MAALTRAHSHARFPLSGHGEINRLVRDLSAPREAFWLFLDLVGDHERNLVLLDAGVENLLVEK
jgi:hypothetical protein